MKETEEGGKITPPHGYTYSKENDLYRKAQTSHPAF